MALRLHLGNTIAPPRFITFAVVTIVAGLFSVPRLGWAQGSMAGFDLAAIIFLISIWPLFDDRADEMRQSAKKNDANRAGLLIITGIVMGVVLSSVASELMQSGRPRPQEIILIVGTLSVAWIFSNVIYALHYAHLFYKVADGGKDLRGIEFPKTEEPDYWDFLYFATCLGMTFQVSDMNITSSKVRRVVMFHCLAAFVFNLGIIAFTINVLGGS
jgi:uncharacterized membrane protein